MNRKLATVYAIVCTLLLAAGFLAVFAIAWEAGVTAAVKSLVGLVLGFIIAPILHELGHVCFAKLSKMECVFVKCFCFKFYTKNGKKKWGFASPFALDETQVLPVVGGDMNRRAAAYTLGGLLFGGVFLTAGVAAAILLNVFHIDCYVLWGVLPYSLYLFLLNVAPFEYAGGKTDMLVYMGIKKGWNAEKTMLSAMEIQGQLYEGKSFAEIDEKWYFDFCPWS